MCAESNWVWTMCMNCVLREQVNWTMCKFCKVASEYEQCVKRASEYEQCVKIASVNNMVRYQTMTMNIVCVSKWVWTVCKIASEYGQCVKIASEYEQCVKIANEYEQWNVNSEMTLLGIDPPKKKKKKRKKRRRPDLNKSHYHISLCQQFAVSWVQVNKLTTWYHLGQYVK